MNGAGARWVQPVQHVLAGPAAGALVQVAVLAVLDAAVGLSTAAWTLGLGVGAAVATLLAAGLVRRGRGLGPADAVTLGRSTLVGGVAALVVDGAGPVVLVPVVVVALVLDGVDGQVARRTRTASELGARFDMEVDALLVLLLSWHVAADVGAWVLVIGLARYLKLVASWAWPWLRATAPPRWWAKVVAAVQGITLVTVASGLLPSVVETVALVAAAALLAESFATEARWLWRHRAAASTPPHRRWATAVALVTVGVAVAAPHTLGSPATTVRLPWEAVGFVALVLVLPERRRTLRTIVVAVTGVLLGGLTVLKVLDVGFQAALNRPFDPLLDWGYADELVALVRDSTGELLGPLLLALVAVLAVATVVGLPLAVRRLADAAVRHGQTAGRAVAAAATVWLALALTAAGGRALPPLAEPGTAAYAWHQVARVPGELRDRAEFERATREDPAAKIAGADLLTHLRGKDVLVVFVESYGQVALTDADLSPAVTEVLAAGESRLARAGFTGRSAWLTSPTFGAVSWLAHASLQTGLWVDSQARYDALVDSPRQSLTSLFGRAGWRTVASIPANTTDWPQGAFYGFDHVYDSRNVGYRGPRFGYPTMPDQFTLEAFWRHELATRDRPPVMAEIDLISSHAPWSRTPRLVDREVVGDGSAFTGMPEQLPSEPEVWTSRERIRQAYADAVAYSLQCVVDFLSAHGDDDLVVVLLGDHQPATVVSGTGVSHDVPVTVLARDPRVLQRIDRWGWDDGLRPADSAPVWRMDAFRDAFLAAYGAGPEQTGADRGGAG